MDASLCTLQDAVGRVETCPGGACPFWDRAACVLEASARILGEQPALAQHLLSLRADLDAARRETEARGHRRLFYRLLNDEQEAESRL